MIYLKNREQIEGIRKSCKLLAEAFYFLEEQIAPGISSQDIDELIHHYIRDKDAYPAFLDYEGFPASICTSVNDTVIHGIPDKIPLKEGDIISLDLGINLDGYISDCAKTFPVGSIKPEVNDLVKRTEESLYKGIGAVRTGGRIKDIGKAINEYIAPFGYGIVYKYCGHGVGIDVHEDPQIPNYYPSRGMNPRIKNGMVLAIEPMINMGLPQVDLLDDNWTVKTIDGSISAHFEHTIAVFDDKVEILTCSD